MENNNQEIINILEKYRGDDSLQVLATNCQVSTQTMYSFYNGKLPSNETLRGIAQFFTIKQNVFGKRAVAKHLLKQVGLVDLL